MAEQVFAALDTNADDGIPIPEYLRVLGQWARAGRKSAEQRIATRRAELADSVNKTADGPPPARPSPGGGPPSVDVVFERFDSNKDGKLQKEEVPEFVRQFILPADANGDNVVTKQELEALRRRRPSGGRPNAGGS